MRNLIKILMFPLALMLFAASLCQNPKPGPPDAGLYHNYAELTADLAQLQTQYPNLAKVVSLGKSVEGRDIWVIKISDNVASDESEPAILFVGGHHAREWIAVDVPFLLAKKLLEDYATNSRVRNYVDSGEIWVLPLLNPDGHQYSITNNRLWRKNRANNGDGTYGVDLNRNYSYKWGGAGSSGSTFSETYRGPSAFSEPESKILRDFAALNQISAMISYHNYSQLVLFPWGYTNDSAPDEALLSQLAATLADSIFNAGSVRYTPEQSSDLYTASGDATDWLYGETRVPAFTIELRPRSSAPGFLLPESQIQPTFRENYPAALFLIGWTQGGGAMTRKK